jgi:hypothetical protein
MQCYSSTVRHYIFLSCLPNDSTKHVFNFRTELTKIDFLDTLTTVFEIVQFEQIEFATARLKTEKWSSYNDHLQHELYGGELVGVPPTLCTTSDKIHGIAQIAAPEQPGDLGCQVKSCFGQIISSRTKIDPTSEVMMYYATMNLYSRHEEVPPCIQGTMTSLSIVPESQSMVQTDIMKSTPSYLNTVLAMCTTQLVFLVSQWQVFLIHSA